MLPLLLMLLLFTGALLLFPWLLLLMRALLWLKMLQLP
jgi:hypothetical protein